MSGHNKWSKIKHKKAITDAKRSKIFSKIARLLSLESKKVCGDINSPTLRAIIEKAKSVNMPNDNIDRAIKRGVGKDILQMSTVVYEAYGPGGSALVINGLTDNNNRTSQEIKHILTKNGATLAGQGSVVWNFDKKELEWLPKTTISLAKKDTIMLEKIIDELEENDDVQDVFVNVKI
ncbi:MAG: YebC/PmpR family DNA-binding transcriptional regulator [Methanosarcinales archaeon]|nr:YebC/PmpR family DNA-binding transcriptional regulator [Methanosarcinales archaeon]